MKKELSLSDLKQVYFLGIGGHWYVCYRPLVFAQWISGSWI